MMNQKQIGRYIAEKRRIKNLTQAQLAEQLGISDKTVSKWENGRSVPDAEVLIRMAAKIRISKELGIEIPSVDQFRELSGWKGVDG